MTRTIEAKTGNVDGRVRVTDVPESGRLLLTVSVEHGHLTVFLTAEEALEVADALEQAIAELRKPVEVTA